MNLNLGNYFRAAFAVVATAGAADTVTGCSLNHPISGWNNDAASDLADVPDTVVVDVPNDREVLDAIEDGRPVDRQPTTDTPSDTSPDAPEVTIIPDAAFIDILDAAADVFPDDTNDATSPEDAGDVVDATAIEAAVDAETPPDITMTMDVADASRVDVTSEDRAFPMDTAAEVGAETGVVDAGVDAAADRVEVDASTVDVAPDATPVDSGPRYTRPAGSVYLSSFPAAGGSVLNAATGIAFGNMTGTGLTTPLGSSASLISTGNNITATDTSLGNLGVGNAIVGAWVTFDAALTGLRTFASKNGAFFFRTNPTSIIFVSGDSSCLINSTSAFPDDRNRHHVAFVRNSGNITLFLDGNPISTSTPCAANLSSSNPLVVGATGSGTLVVGGVLTRFFVSTDPSATSQTGLRQLICYDLENAGLSLLPFCS